MVKFSADLNAEARRVVKSFNQKIRRAEARGQKGLPQLRSVRELKAQFATEHDLKREIGLLKTMLNNKQALQRRVTKDGTISNWEYEYIAKNLQATKAWVERSLEKEQKRLAQYPEHLYAIRADIHKLEAEKEIINRNLNKLTARELKTVGTVVGRMKRENLKTRAGRVYFMDNLNFLLRASGMPNTTRKEVAEKLNQLTNEQFLQLYKNHDIIADIMSKLPSDPKREMEDGRMEQAKLIVSTDDDIIEELNSFVDNIDDYVEEAKL